MHRGSVLHSVACDLKRLPIGAREAFVLSQVHGRSTAEELAEVTGLELKELLQVARRLVELGALSVEGEAPKTKRPPRRTERPSASHSVAPAAHGLVPPAVVPVARACPDLRSLGLGPREGFVLSQIDGATSTEDLVEITHLSLSDLSDALNALEEAGAVELSHRKRRATRVPPARSTKVPPARETKAPAARGTKAPRAAAPKSHEKRLSELPQADRQRIAEAVARVEPLDHYGALGVDRDADAKTIRRAYHALAARFHPDRFFRKDLGASRQPLERLFGRLTLAYETLSRAGTRDEYDRTLPPRPAPRTPTERPPKTPTRKSMRAVRPPTEPPKREAIAPVAPPPEIAPAPAPPPIPASAATPSSPDALRRMYAGKKRDTVREHVEVFVRAASEALERDDVVAAANHYRLAVQCSDDPSLRAALAETDVKARARVRDVSLAGARAAEAAGRWGEAATKYAKAHGVHPEAWIAERAANAIRREGGDLRRAAQLAEQAVLAEPHNVGYRVTLGEIYLDAGLMARATGESGRATGLAPADARAIALAKAVARAKGA
jgi:tetratricopeptide (TPR) repeat protein